MSLDNDSFVRLLYRVFLDRDPDPHGFDLHLARLRSGEIDHETLALEFSLSEERQKRALFTANLSQEGDERDTDRDWTWIADSLPYFGVLSNDKFINPTPDSLAEFFATGDRDVEQTLGMIRRRFGDFTPRSALDFGCGVGRLLIPMAKRTGRAAGPRC